MSRLMQSLALDSKRVYLRCWFVLVSSEKLRRTFPSSRLVVFGRSVMRLELLQMFSVPCVTQLLYSLSTCFLWHGRSGDLIGSAHKCKSLEPVRTASFLVFSSGPALESC